jgi:hypothetical protein
MPSPSTSYSSAPLHCMDLKVVTPSLPLPAEEPQDDQVRQHDALHLLAAWLASPPCVCVGSSVQIKTQRPIVTPRLGVPAHPSFEFGVSSHNKETSKQ